MKGITKGEWYLFNQDSGVYVYTELDRYNAIARFYKEDNPHSDNAIHNARIICTAGNLTNAGYNIEAMPQLVEALEDMKVFFHSWLQQDSETLGYKAAIKALEALKYAKL